MLKNAFLLILCHLSFVTNAAVSADDFFQKPDVIQARLSPSGTHVATIKYAEDHNLVALLNTNTMEEKVILDTLKIANKESKLHYIDWVDNRYIAARFSETKDGIRGFTHTQKSYSTIIIDTQTSTGDIPSVKKIRTKGALIDSLPEQEGVFVYGKSLAYSKLYRINIDPLSAVNKKLSKFEKIDGGQFTKTNEIFSIEGFVTRWFLNKDGKPSAVLTYNDEDELNLVTISPEDGDSEVLKTWTEEQRDTGEANKVLLPIAASEEPFTYYCLDRAEEEERNIYKVNFKTNDEELIYTTSAFKILDLIFSHQPKKLIGVRLLVDGEIRDSFFEAEKISHPDQDERLTVDLGYSSNRKLKLSYSQSYLQAGQYALHNNQNDTSKVVGFDYIQLKEPLNGQQTLGSVVVEGLKIPYILNTPTQASDSPLPLIVMPHGGPVGVYDNVYFDLETQFFVANGFAVLRVNYRGSGGFSEEFTDAGKLEWGNLMLVDIHTAAQDVARLTNIDANRICLFGASYGGYAATRLAINHPSFYQCAVNFAGVSDLNLLIENSKHSNRTRKWYKDQLIADPELTYSEQLNPLSPVYLVEKLDVPILVIHGDQDTVVDPEHAHRLRLMLEKYNKPYEWLILSGAKHSNNKIDDIQTLFSNSLAFIQKHTASNIQ